MNRRNMLTTLGLGSGALFSLPAIARIAGFDAGSRREALATSRPRMGFARHAAPARKTCIFSGRNLRVGYTA